MYRVALLVLVSAVVSGCYTSTAIRPTELPKLNGAGADLRSAGGADVYVVSRGHVEGPDGRIVEVDGEFDAVVTTSGGERVDFDYPVIASATEAALTVAGSNRGQTEFQLGDIREVRVKQWSQWNGVWVALVVPAAIIGTSGLIFLAVQ